MKKRQWANRSNWGDADWVRHYLDKAKLSQRYAAKVLGINERTMRHYCADAPVPKAVLYALEHLSENPKEIPEQIIAPRGRPKIPK